jgi:hypothetical protein
VATYLPRPTKGHKQRVQAREGRGDCIVHLASALPGFTIGPEAGLPLPAVVGRPRQGVLLTNHIHPIQNQQTRSPVAPFWNLWVPACLWNPMHRPNHEASLDFSQCLGQKASPFLCIQLACAQFLFLFLHLQRGGGDYVYMKPFFSLMHHTTLIPQLDYVINVLCCYNEGSRVHPQKPLRVRIHPHPSSARLTTHKFPLLLLLPPLSHAPGSSNTLL